MKLCFATTLFALGACVPLAAAQDETISDIVKGSEDFTVLESFLTATGLIDVLDTPDLDATVFAPDDDAFGKVDAELAATLLTPEWVEHTRCILGYHVVPGIARSGDLEEDQVLTTLNEEDLTVSLDPPTLTGVANSAEIINVDIEASNGIIHVIDDVLLPTCITSTIGAIAQSNPDFSILVDLAERADLLDALVSPGPITVFAPTNQAFEALGDDVLEFLKDPQNFEALQATLLHHVFSGNLYSSTLPAGFVSVPSLQGTTAYFNGDQLRINDVDIEAVDILASNGVIHVLNEVMLLPSINDFLQEAPVLTGDDDLSFVSLVDALELADLSAVFDVDDANDPTKYTVFAPTDNAFDAAPSLLGKFVEPEWIDTHLTQVLLHHVVPGAVDAEAVAALETVEPLSGVPLNIGVAEGVVSIDNADVISADNVVFNGIVHGIDELLVPASMTQTIVDIAVADEQFSTLVNALELTGLTEALQGEGPFTVFAPVNSAFDGIDLPSDVNDIEEVLLYHVVGENVILKDGDVLTTLQGDVLDIAEDGDGSFAVNGVEILGTVYTSNGIIHVIDAVLLPPITTPEAFQLTPVNFDGCMAVDGHGRNDDSLLLASCHSNADSQKWSYDVDGLLRTALDENKCLQAGRDNEPMDGNKMRIFPCDKNHPKQKFDWANGEPLKLAGQPDLCVVFRGVTANINHDPIIVKTCGAIKKNRRDWETN